MLQLINHAAVSGKPLVHIVFRNGVENRLIRVCSLRFEEEFLMDYLFFMETVAAFVYDKPLILLRGPPQQLMDTTSPQFKNFGQIAAQRASGPRLPRTSRSER